MASVIDNDTTNAISGAQGFVKTVRDSIFSIMSAVNVGRFDKSFLQSGFQFGMGRNGTAGASVSQDPFTELYPREYNIASTNPVANVIIKKRMFTTLAYDNDIRFLDSNERAFLRTSKTLFQLKAFQIATYEALTKFEQNLQQNKTLYVPAILAAIQNANSFGAISDDETNSMTSTLLQITQRDLAGDDSNYTQWFIDQFDSDLANIGKGVGVIEFTNFSKVDCSNNLNDGSATVEFEDPYHIMMISNADIENAIKSALFNDNATIFSSLDIDNLRNLSDNLNAQQQNNTVNISQANAAINDLQNTAANVLSNPNSSSPLVSFVRSKMRKFYLGRSVIQPTDGINIFMKSDTIYENDQDPVGLPLGLDRYGIDEEILRQEMYAVTKDKNFDINLYKTLRNPNAFSGASTFTGVIEKATDNFNDGFYTLTVSAKNNLWFLEQSFINAEPALDQSQGLLHDPLTQFDFQFDSFGNIKTTSTDGSVGFQLSQDNIDRLSQVNIKYDNGSQRGTQVSTDNILGGNSPGTDVKQAQHYPGMLYKWKEGIASLAIAMNTSDPTGLFSNQSRETANNTYGLAITSTPFDNMDAANVISLLVTGIPYNISSFINDSFTSIASNVLGTKSSSDSSSYFNTFFDVIQRQNKVLGNFRPLLNGNSVNIDTLKKLAYKKVSYRQLDTRIAELETQIFAAQEKKNNLSKQTATDIITKTINGLDAEIASLQQEENALIQQFATVSSDIDTVSNNQDALGFSTDPEQREVEMRNYQFQQLYAASRRIEDVRYNRDINYFIVGTEYDSDTDIQAFQANMRNGFKYFDNRYDPAITKAREAAKTIDFEFFADASGNIRFRPPQYNKVPLSIYYELFRKSSQGVDLLPNFVKDLFVDNITALHENIVALNWDMLLKLGKSGNDTLINAMNAYVNNKNGIVGFLGFDGTSTFVTDGNTVDQLLEFTSADQVMINNAAPISTVSTNNNLNLDILQNIATQTEKRFGGSRITVSADDIINQNDNAAIVKRKNLFNDLRTDSSKRNALVKKYNGLLDNLGISSSDIDNSGSAQQQQSNTNDAVNKAVAAKQDKLSQQILQIVSTGNSQGYARPVISNEFQNLVEDDSRNFIGRGSGRRFIIRDDTIKSCRIDEGQPDYCRINVNGAYNLIDGHTVMENRWLWAGACDFDLWRMYGFKQGEDIKAPFLNDPETQLKPYAVFQLLKQRKKVLKGSVTVIGNEYYQIGDVVYLPDRDLLFYTTGVSHSFVNGEDYTTTLTLEYGRPPGEYIPSPLDVIGKTMLKQNLSSQAITRRQIIPDTFYYPLRPTPVMFLSNIKSNDIGDDAMGKMLGIDSNQGRLINALMNANTALQKPNSILVISGFKTGSDNDDDVQSRINVIKQWFTTPKLMSNGLSGRALTEFKDYSAIPAAKIITKTLDLTNDEKGDDSTSQDPNDVIASDQSIINAIGDSNLELGILSACQEAYSLIGDLDSLKDNLPYVIEVGIFYGKQNNGK